MKRTIVYSHGFGAKRDARGMFTDIAALFPACRHIQFDYNELIDEKTLRVRPLEEQVNILRDVLQRENVADADLVAHSQGCVVAALALPRCVRKAVFIAPPPKFDIEHFIAAFRDRPGAVVDMKAESRVPRRDGSVSLVPASYWESLRHADPIAAYNMFAKTAEIVFITGNQDDVFPDSIYPGLDPKIRIVAIDGDHNMSGEHRPEMLDVVRDALKAGD